MMAVPSALAYEKLQRGSSGEEVLCMQKALQSLGYTMTLDGKFGYATEKVVKSFQKKYNLTADGVAGNQTLTALYALVPEFAPATSNASAPAPTAAPTKVPAAAPTGSASSSSYEKLSRGASGEAVLRMQKALKALGYSITTDGKFGAESEKYVKAFQRDNGLTADGVAGEKTLTLLYAQTQATSAPVISPTPTTAPTAPPTAAPAIPPVSGGVQALVVTGGGALNFRASPNGEAAILAAIPEGEWLIVTARGDTWSQAAYQGVTGYVMSRYLSFGAATATALPTAPPTPTAVPTAAPTVPPASGTIAYVQTTGGTLNLRAAANSNAKILTTIPYGTALTITSRGST